MEFKDLPKEIQTIAATTLGDSLVKIDPAYTKKETIDNMVRNVRNAFSGLYGSDNQKQESDVNKRVISVCVNGHVLSSIKTETATVFDCLCIVQSLVDNPDEVSVTERAADGETVFEVRVADGDMGKVIGRQGRIVKEIRILMRAVAQRQGKKVSVEIMD